jgi:hypothetical protein
MQPRPGKLCAVEARFLVFFRPSTLLQTMLRMQERDLNTTRNLHGGGVSCMR